MSLNLCSLDLSPPVLSGWYFFARSRYFFLISSGLASSPTPRILYRSFSINCRSSPSRGLVVSGRAAAAEGDLAARDVGLDLVAAFELALEERLGQRILDEPLDGALERPRPEGRIVAALGDELARRLGEDELDVAGAEELREARDLDVDDLGELLPAERLEDHRLVDAVQELGPEQLAQPPRVGPAGPDYDPAPA